MGQQAAEQGGVPSPRGTRPVWFDDAFVETPVYHRNLFAPGHRLTGPAIIEETESTTVVPSDFSVSVDGSLNLVLRRGSE